MSGFAGYPGLVAPRQATARDETRPTYGGHVAAVAEAMGWPLLPWQQYVADVAGEVDDEGVFIYSTIVVTVQRQAGKTTLDAAEAIQNSLLGPNRRGWYTAQTGQHASAKWRDMVDNYFEQSILNDMAKAKRGKGSEVLKFVNGSEFSPHPPTEDSLHSKQSDRNTIDEAWAFNRVQFNALKGAIVPTTTTRKKLTGQRPQLWIMSTEGTAESEAFNDLLAQLRAGDVPGYAFFDWGIPHDLQLPDLEDKAAVKAFLDGCYSHHPGAGYLFDRKDLDPWLTDLGLSEFARAYGNRRTGATERVIPEADWNAAATLEPLPADAPLCFAAAVGKDGTDTTVTATALLPDGRKITEVIRYGLGTAWALDFIRELQAAQGAPFVIDRYGPSADLRDQAERAGVNLLDVDSRSVTGACSAVFAGIVHRAEDGAKLPPTWLHRPHEAMNTAADVAAKRSVGDGAWAWARRASSGSVGPLEAGTLSTWGVDHLPAKRELQFFV